METAKGRSQATWPEKAEGREGECKGEREEWIERGEAYKGVDEYSKDTTKGFNMYLENTAHNTYQLCTCSILQQINWLYLSVTM